MPRWNIDITDRVCDILTLLGIADAYSEPERSRTIALAQTKAHAVRQLIGNDALRKSAWRLDKMAKQQARDAARYEVGA